MDESGSGRAELNNCVAVEVLDRGHGLKRYVGGRKKKSNRNRECEERKERDEINQQVGGVNVWC